jgi:hypothetical protein
MLELLVNPNAFFSKRKTTKPKLGISVLIVLIYSIPSAITIILLSIEIEGEIVFPIGQRIGQSIKRIVGSYLGWLLFSAVFYGISALFKGEGRFGKVAEFIALGYIPLIFGEIINHCIYYYILLSSAQAIALNMLRTHQWLGAIIGIVFTLWSTILWIFGLKHARNLTTRNAIISVAIPVAASLSLNIYLLKIGYVILI